MCGIPRASLKQFKRPGTAPQPCTQQKGVQLVRSEMCGTLLACVSNNCRNQAQHHGPAFTKRMCNWWMQARLERCCSRLNHPPLALGRRWLVHVQVWVGNGYNGYNRGRRSARLFGWSAADWSRPATNKSISSERKKKKSIVLLRKEIMNKLVVDLLQH